MAISAQDMENFISGLNVKIISLFETKPRRRKEDSVPEDRKAFRVCINKTDQERLMDETVWPDYVSVSEWFFKSSQGAAQQPSVRSTEVPMTTEDADRTIVTDYEPQSGQQSNVSNG